jgi:hypothetical protein
VPRGFGGSRQGNEKDVAMGQGSASPGRLSQGEQRALASFLAGRMPAGQLHGELCRAREAALAAAVERQRPPEPAPLPAPVLRAA